MKLSRRRALESLAASTVLAHAGPRLYAHDGEVHAPKFCVFVQADGAWDPTSFCDPKANVPGEKIINHWALDSEIRQAGNIRYAPFANNETFFEKYYERMLVVNGVDAQTNSHTVGVVHNWSGQNSEGFPSTTAMYAATHDAGLVMTYLNFGGYGVTGGLTRATRIENVNTLREVMTPNYYRNDGERPLLYDEDYKSVVEYAAQAAHGRGQRIGATKRVQQHTNNHLLSLLNKQGFMEYGQALDAAGAIEDVQRVTSSRGRTFRSSLRRQAQLTVLAFKTNVACASDLRQGGFDTHENHDEEQAIVMNYLTDGVDYLWDYAEEHGVADRMFVVIGSDFGRTNFYNGDAGKDHWPIGSFVFMEKNQPWTNRVVGATDDLHFAHRINPSTLEVDDTNGTIIYPKHVHKALRKYLELNDSVGDLQFPFNNVEDFAFFNS